MSAGTDTALRLVVPAEPEQPLPLRGPEVVVDFAVDLAEEVDMLDDYIATLQDHISYLESLPHIAPQTNWDLRVALAGIVIGIILMASGNYVLFAFLGMTW